MNYTTRQIAKQRIQVLFEQAIRVHTANAELSRRYVKVARKIAMAARLRFPPTYKRKVCKNCNNLMIPGETSRVRIQPRREPHSVTTCLNCGWQSRIPLKQKKTEKKQNEQDNNQNETSRKT